MDQENRPLLELQHSRKHGVTRLKVSLENVAQATAATAAVVGTVLAAVATANGSDADQNGLPGWFLPSAVVTVVLVTLAVIAAVIVRERRRAAERKAEAARVENAAEHLRERMELASLVNFNRVLLENYHGIATRQANKSFAASLAAMGLGLLVLVGAFWASMQYNAMGERVFIGSLAAISTTFVGYLSKTFFAVYDRSLKQLNQYFNQPVLNGYFLTAERIAEKLEPEKRQELTAQIVKDVLDTGKRMHQMSVSQNTEPKTQTKVTRQRRPPVEQTTSQP